MALIVYPTEDYDSFVSVADATTIIGNLTLYSSEWGALDLSEQEAYLRIASQVITDGLTTIPADPVPQCLKNSQALIAIHDVVNGISKPLTIESVVKKQKAGSVEIEYFEPNSTGTTNNRIPSLAATCLEGLGYEFPISGFGLKRATLVRS
jgi:hypothetical protein